MTHLYYLNKFASNKTPKTQATPTTTVTPKTTVTPETTATPNTQVTPTTTDTTVTPDNTVTHETTVTPETQEAPETQVTPEATAKPETNAQQHQQQPQKASNFAQFLNTPEGKQMMLWLLIGGLGTAGIGAMTGSNNFLPMLIGGAGIGAGLYAGKRWLETPTSRAKLRSPSTWRYVLDDFKENRGKAEIRKRINNFFGSKILQTDAERNAKYVY